MRFSTGLALTGAACISTATWTAATVRAAPVPKLARTVVVSTASGTVLVKAPGAQRFTRLARTKTALPTASTIDATRGQVRLVSSRGARRAVNSAVFSGGEFTVNQASRGGGVTDLQLVGGDPRACRASTGSAKLSATLRRLLGVAHGNFRTHGNYASATVRGTIWLTEDRCDGTTVISDRRGSVQTADQYGDLNPSALSLGPGDSAVFYCSQNGQPPISSRFCTAAVSNAASGQLGTGLLNFGPATSYDLCVTEPNSTVTCIPGIALSAPQPDGRRISAFVCTPFAGPGTYLFTWRIGGVVLGPPLQASSNKPVQPRQCANYTA